VLRRVSTCYPGSCVIAYIEHVREIRMKRMYEAIKHAENVGARTGCGTFGLDARLEFG
jgi:hypothetical protein